jgi:polyribonucleotide nucleotidyltransferase
VETVLRCLVPAAEIGQVIGPKGKTVQSMRDRSGATIKVHEGNSGAAFLLFQGSIVNRVPQWWSPAGHRS